MALPAATYATLAAAIIAANRALGALQCYHCVGVVEGSKNEGILGTLLKPGEQSYEDCIAAPVLGVFSLPTKACEEDEVCASIRTQVETTTEQYGQKISTVVARSCQRPGPTNQKSGCVRDQLQFSELLGMFSTQTTEDEEMQVCYCDMPYCSAGECKKNDIKIVGYCFVYWVLILLGLVGLLSLILLTCCCFCCCCCCCRPCKKKPSGYVVAGSGDGGGSGKDVA